MDHLTSPGASLTSQGASLAREPAPPEKKLEGSHTRLVALECNYPAVCLHSRAT